MELQKLTDFNNLYMVEGFLKEYKGLFGKSQRNYEKALSKLRVNLGILDAEGSHAIQYQQFEQLEKDLYSIRHVSKINPRTIYTYIEDSGKVILLCSLLEKNASDYDSAIKRCRGILKSLEEEIRENG